MESKEQLRKIAIRCNEYEAGSENRESCLNCIHYVRHVCELDLIDKVLSSMAMDLDLK